MTCFKPCSTSSLLSPGWNVTTCLQFQVNFRNVNKYTAHLLRKSFIIFFIWILLPIHSPLEHHSGTKSFSADCFLGESSTHHTCFSHCSHCLWLKERASFEVYWLIMATCLSLDKSSSTDQRKKSSNYPWLATQKGVYVKSKFNLGQVILSTNGFLSF